MGLVIMKDISLIKKIEYEDDLSKPYPVTFNIDIGYDKAKARSIFNEIKEQSLLAQDILNLGNNSFTIHIPLTNIPKITKILLKYKFNFYGIYVVYDNYLEMKEVEDE